MGPAWTHAMDQIWPRLGLVHWPTLVVLDDEERMGPRVSPAGVVRWSELESGGGVHHRNQPGVHGDARTRSSSPLRTPPRRTAGCRAVRRSIQRGRRAL